MSASLPPQSDLEAKLSLDEQGRLRRELMCAMTNAQGAWLEKVMRRLMPAKLFKMAHDESGPFEAYEKRQKTVAEWLDKNDIRVVQRGARIQQVYLGKELLSTFVVKLAEK